MLSYGPTSFPLSSISCVFPTPLPSVSVHNFPQLSVLHSHCAATSYHTIVFSPISELFFPLHFIGRPNYLIMLPLRYSYVLTLTFQLTQ